jgi:hypothetical protein
MDSKKRCRFSFAITIIFFIFTLAIPIFSWGQRIRHYCTSGYCHKTYFPYSRVYIRKYTQPCTYRSDYVLDLATGDDDPSCYADMNIDR